MTKFTITGASGLVGSQLVDLLTAEGHEVVAASRSTGVDVLTGEGLAAALAGADVLVDVTNSPSYEDDPVLAFFTTATANQLAAAKAAGVGHYVALSIVGADGMLDSGYLRAKIAQETAIVDSGLPYSVVRATQFAEFASGIVASLVVGDEVRVPDALIQPIVAADVVAELARVAVGGPLNGIVNIGGPDKISFATLAGAVLSTLGDDKTVTVDPAATYFGAHVGEFSLVTGDEATLAETRFSDWLASR